MSPVRQQQQTKQQQLKGKVEHIEHVSQMRFGQASEMWMHMCAAFVIAYHKRRQHLGFMWLAWKGMTQQPAMATRLCR
jgi:hypothetical protein